jgi:putative addiction module component (TIGR02574 family)
MNERLAFPPPGFEKLTAEEQIDYVQSLWDHVAADSTNVPVPDWHMKVLAERLADLDASPSGTVDWADFRTELLAKLSSQATGDS